VVGAVGQAGGRYELVVVGGGIVGLCVAAEARRRVPEATVAVLDRGRVGGGASAYSPGIQIALGRTEAERRLAARGLRSWRRMLSEGSRAFGRTCDLYWITADPASLRRMHVGRGLRDSTPEALASRLRSLDQPAVPKDHAVLVDECSYSPVSRVVDTLRRQLVEAGCDLREGVEAAELQPNGAEVAVRRRDGSVVAGETAVVALGPWAPASPLMVGAVVTGLRVKKVVSLHLDREPSADCPAIAFHEDYAFLVPMPEEAYWLFSFTSEHWDVDPEPATLRVDAADLEKARRILDRWFPGRAPAVASARVFCDCYSRDSLPVVGRHRHTPSVAFVAAGSGNGFRFAPPCAEEALDLVGLGAR